MAKFEARIQRCEGMEVSCEREGGREGGRDNETGDFTNLFGQYLSGFGQLDNLDLADALSILDRL
jgi:hypothetical protein